MYTKNREHVLHINIYTGSKKIQKVNKNDKERLKDGKHQSIKLGIETR